MAKNQPKAAASEKTETTTEGAAAPAAEKSAKSTQGSAIVLPNGVRRIDFIRDHYYAPEGSPEKMSRSQIKNAINEMYKNAGQESTEIAYQIVFAATKEDTDPRKKAPATSTDAPAQDAASAA